MKKAIRSSRLASEFFLYIFLILSADLYAIEERDYKKLIQREVQTLSSLQGSKRGWSLYQLSLLYLKDQDLELAFKTFLEALQYTDACTKDGLNNAPIYEEAFSIYVDNKSLSSEEIAKLLLSLLEPYLKEHDNETLLEFYTAIAYANLGKYTEFLERFYKAYQSYPEHYLSYRTKAILYAKLLEREGDIGKKGEFRKAIVDNLKLGVEKEPRDTTLYKLIISFADKETKNKEIRVCLNKILKANIIIPRTDLLFYIQQAVSANELSLGAYFIARAREWYPSSQLIDAAEQYLNVHKGALKNE